MRTLPIVSLLLASASFAADPPPLNTRVDRIEKELRAVQRKVFPGGAPAFTEPEIAAPTVTAPMAGAPASQPLNDLIARVDGIEREVARLTNQLEQDEHRLTLLSEQAAQDRQAWEARLTALEAGAPAAASTTRVPASAPPVRGSAAAPAPVDLASSPFRTPATSKTTKPAPVPTTDDTVAAPPTSNAAVSTGGADPSDPAEAAYMAGYRLWADKNYAAAEDALGKVAAQYPKHRRASYARNLQGRAYLDDGQPAEAARTLYANYQKDPRGERAPESLFYLGQALTQLKKNPDACKAYGELQTVYGAKMGDTLRNRLPAARKAAECGDDVTDATPAKPATRASSTSSSKRR